MLFLPHHYTLQCHPTGVHAAISGLNVSLLDGPPRAWHWRYHLNADVCRLIVAPAFASAQRQDLLWQHTCFEAFVGVVGSTAYREFNFAPSGHWACYDFLDYRQAASAAQTHPAIPAPQISCRLEPQSVQLDVVLPAASLPPHAAKDTLQWGLCAVVIAFDGTKTYWALSHPAPHADFHQRASFSVLTP